MIIPEIEEIETINFIKYVKEMLSIAKDKGMEFIGKIVYTNKLSYRKASKIFGLCRQTIRKAVNIFLGVVSYKADKETRGRNKIEEKNPEIVSHIKEICENTENIDKSLRADIIYIDVSAGYVRERLISEYGYDDNNCPCENTIRRIFKEGLGYKITKVKKNKVLKKIPETDAIFENVNAKKEEVKNSADNVAIYSIDDKATKLIGDLSDGGCSWIEKEALDHDTMPKYRVKPFGLCNMKTNETNVYLTTSSSTAKFKADCLEKQIRKDKEKNPNIRTVYLFLDNGPENSSRRTLWIWSLITISIKLNVKIELVYYPPYHSKYNLIEHFWGVLQRSWNGLIINNLTKLIGAINGTKWHGINAKGILVEKEYFKGETVDKKELKKLIEKHVIYENEGIEKWSLVITP